MMRRLSVQAGLAGLTRLGLVLGLAGASAAPSADGPVPCAGGTLDISAVSDTPFTLPTFNVGQRTTLAAVTTGFTAASFAWTIPGPHIKDYNDDLGTQLASPPTTPLAWGTTALAPADLAASAVSFYWKPSAAQIHPLLGPPEPRVVSLTVTPSAGGSCTSSTTLMIERNMTDAAKQPEDLYTSTHRAPTTTNPGFGHVVDEHIYWHQFVGGGTDWRQFLAWHGYFLRRFDEWRVEFGYPVVAPWYPGRPLPTGPAFDHPASLRLAFNPDANRIPTYFTIAGGTTADFGGQTKLGDYATVALFTNSFEGSYHGLVHCNIGPATGGFFATSGPGFGSMCRASSPKDPLFWQWHGFIDVMYRNYCRLRGIPCLSGPDPTSDPWLGDNDPDIAANGNVPSAAPRWLSPDIWNRRTEVTTDACIPRDPPPNVNTVGGVTPECGSSADHENPVTGTTNFLYATLRNTRPGQARNAYTEVAVYIANASTGLAWPTDFTMLPQSRQLITLHLEPGQVTDIGPLPWTPPSPAPSDHWCLYIHVLSVQEVPLVEGANVDTNVANSNSIAWRNVKIVAPGERRKSAAFIVRNIQKGDERLGLQIDAEPALLRTGTLALRLDSRLTRALAAGDPKLEGLQTKEPGHLIVISPKSRVEGFRLAAREQGVATVELDARAENTTEGDVQVTQLSGKGIDGGVTLRVGNQPPKK